MKIAVLRRRYRPHGGGERFADEFLQRLAVEGHEVHLFCHAWPNAPATVAIHRVPLAVGGSATQTLAYAMLAPLAARRCGFDLIHSFERTVWQDMYRAGEGCHREWLALRRQHLGRAQRAADCLRPFHRIVLFLEDRICRRGGASLVVVNSNMVDADFRRHYGLLRPHVTLVRNGVDLVRFRPDVRGAARAAARMALGVGPDELVLLTLGSGVTRKGTATVIRALAELRRHSRLAVTAIVAGRDSGAERVARLVSGADVGDRVRLVGAVSDPVPLYAAADVFALPSMYDPASNATLEAMAMGLPVITSRTNGSAELIEHGVSGWLLTDASDAVELSRLIEAAAEAGSRARVGEAARKAVEPWSWARHLADTLALYRNVPSSAQT